MKRTCLHHASEVLKTRTSLFLFVSALCTDIQYPVCIPHAVLHHTTIPDQWFLDNQDERPPFTIDQYSFTEWCIGSHYSSVRVKWVESCLVSLVFSDLTCEDNQNYVKFYKKSGYSASDESFVIKDGNAIVYTSPTFENDKLRTLEACLPSSTNNQYILEMKDSGNNRWAYNSYLEVVGVNGNTIFKSFMIELSLEVYPLSLYSPINKSAVWKFSQSATGAWTTPSFADSTWTEMTPASSTTAVSGTQYFRKSFIGISGMAAVEMQYKYRAGIVAYINGVEVFRDNMPSGSVTSSTLATGSYSAADFHGIIRSAKVAESTQSVLAVELHFTSAMEFTISFDAFVSFMAGVSSTNHCYRVPLNVTATSEQYSNPEDAFDYDRNNYISIRSTALPASLTASFVGNVKVLVNGFSFYTSTSARSMPRELRMEGSNSYAGGFETIMNPKGYTPENNMWLTFTMLQDPPLYSYFRLHTMESGSIYVSFYKMRFLVCNNPLPTSFSYAETSYSFYKDYTSVNIPSGIYGLDSCTATPALPEGVVLDQSSCTISGISRATLGATLFTIRGTVGSQTLQTTVTLSFTECSGTMLHIRRTYNWNGELEGFRIRNTADDSLLYEVPVREQHPMGTWDDYFCVNVERYDLTLNCEETSWAMNSYIYLYSVRSDGEEDLLVKGRYDGDEASEIAFYLRSPTIHDSKGWYYKMGSVPENWFNEDTNGWSMGKRGSYPESSNQIQLYKRTFSVSDLNIVSGLILSIRYKYGCVVYLNGHEAWRNGVSGTLSASSTATQAYETLMYRTVTLPGKIVPSEGAVLENLKEGTNVIAIAVVAVNPNQKTSDFDAMVRLMTEHSEGHLWEISGTTEGMYGPATASFDSDRGSMNYGSTCQNTLMIQMDNDRREWFSSIQIQNDYVQLQDMPTQFSLYARNSDTEEWTLIRAVTGLVYSMPGQKKRIFTYNYTPYNQFKFENFCSGNLDKQRWSVQTLNLLTEHFLGTTLPLAYEDTNVFLSIEMAELTPVNSGYGEFTIAPALPVGLSFDAQNGWISGTPTQLSAETTYTVNAKSAAGVATSTTFKLAVVVCGGEYGLMTVRIYGDRYVEENWWKLFSGRTTEGSPLRSVTQFPVSMAYYYLDFCLDNGLYTFQAFDGFGDGWAAGAGYTLTVDVGAMELYVQTLPDSGMMRTPMNRTTVFSSYFPFQVNITTWKVYQGEKVDGWNGVGFDDAAWQTMKAEEIPNGESVTTYIRKSFQLTGVDDYQVLNVRMKYAGGVAVYFNGNKVARFNLASHFDANTESLELHDATVFSKFHIILSTAGVQEGENVIAFEVHRPVGTSSSEPFVFDATGVFGVETCTPALDSYKTLEITGLDSGLVEDVMDLDPHTTGKLSDSEDTSIVWTVENLEGSKWNSFSLLGYNEVTMGFAVETQFSKGDEYVRILSMPEYTFKDRVTSQVSVPVAMGGFHSYRWMVINSGRDNTVSSVHLSYCKAQGAICPGMGEYPSVSEGQISPSVCPAGYKGYAYRECVDGKLSEVKTDHCIQKLPENVRYASSHLIFVLSAGGNVAIPDYENVVEKWYVDDGVELPAGLTLNAETGVISGTPSSLQDLKTYTIFAENQAGVVSVEVAISVRKGQCSADSVFPTTTVEETAVYECAKKGSYIGTQKRSCVLGEKDGVWEKASGMCVSVPLLIVFIVLAIAIVGVVVWMVMRSSRKAKSVGGVKGKKKSAKV